jgi:hypothetical protein
MFAPADIEIAEPPDAAEGIDDRAERRLAMLGALAEIGLALAREVGRRVTERAHGDDADDGPDVADAALAYSRIARAVRLTLALEAKMEADLRALNAPREAAAAEARARAADRRACASARGLMRKYEALDGLCEAIDEQAGEGAEAENAAEALKERLVERLNDTPDIDFADAPLAELVETICRELGVPFDPELWAEDDDDAPMGAATVRAPGYSSAPPGGFSPALRAQLRRQNGQGP